MRITWGKVIAIVVIVAMVGVIRAIDTGSLDLSEYIPSVNIGK